MTQIYVHFSGPGSSCSLWTGPTPPPSSQSCATMFSATGYRIALSRFPGKPFAFALFKLPEKKHGQQLCLVQVCNAQSLWLLPAVGAQLGIQVQSNGDMVWELFFYSSSAGRKAFWMKCATMQLTSLPCRRWRLLLKSLS